jgi:hypothetical protein
MGTTEDFNQHCWLSVFHVYPAQLGVISHWSLQSFADCLMLVEPSFMFCPPLSLPENGPLQLLTSSDGTVVVGDTVVVGATVVVGPTPEPGHWWGLPVSEHSPQLALHRKQLPHVQLGCGHQQQKG